MVLGFMEKGNGAVSGSAGSNGQLRSSGEPVILPVMKPDIDPKLLNDPVFQRVLADGLAIQDRFKAEPLYAKTGKGYLKSVGVGELQAAKRKMKRKGK
jgi:hypothetical protein